MGGAGVRGRVCVFPISGRERASRWAARAAQGCVRKSTPGEVNGRHAHQSPFRRPQHGVGVHEVRTWRLPDATIARAGDAAFSRAASIARAAPLLPRTAAPPPARQSPHPTPTPGDQVRGPLTWSYRSTSPTTTALGATQASGDMVGTRGPSGTSERCRQNGSSAGWTGLDAGADVETAATWAKRQLVVVAVDEAGVVPPASSAERRASSSAAVRRMIVRRHKKNGCEGGGSSLRLLGAQARVCPNSAHGGGGKGALCTGPSFDSVKHDRASLFFFNLHPRPRPTRAARPPSPPSRPAPPQPPHQ